MVKSNGFVRVQFTLFRNFELIPSADELIFVTLPPHPSTTNILNIIISNFLRPSISSPEWVNLLIRQMWDSNKSVWLESKVKDCHLWFVRLPFNYHLFILSTLYADSSKTPKTSNEGEFVGRSMWRRQSRLFTRYLIRITISVFRPTTYREVPTTATTLIAL